MKLMIRSAFILYLAGQAVSCSSSSKEQEAAGVKVRSLDTFMNKGYDRRKRDWDHDMRSRYDQKTYSAGQAVKSREFKTDAFAGKQEYSGAGKFESAEYQQATKGSALANQAFNQSGKTAPDSSRGFDAQSSDYQNQQARQGDQAFAAADEKYKTRAVSDAAKSQKKNVRPFIIQGEPESSKPTYQEADIKRMINRN